ncbi:MAG: hypothetical protein ACI39R_06600 [Lachnospiraceae bacterium]
MKKLFLEKLCVIMVVVMLVITPAYAFDFTDIIIMLKRQPDYKNDYGQCWINNYKYGASAYTESFYTYGSCTELLYKYKDSNGKVLTKYASGASYSGDPSKAELSPGGTHIDTYFSCNAYRFNYRVTLKYSN